MTVCNQLCGFLFYQLQGLLLIAIEVRPENMADDTRIDLSQYFTSDQLKLMSTYERTRNENLIRNYEYMKSIGRCIFIISCSKFSGVSNSYVTCCSKSMVVDVDTFQSMKMLKESKVASARTWSLNTFRCSQKIHRFLEMQKK